MISNASSIRQRHIGMSASLCSHYSAHRDHIAFAFLAMLGAISLLVAFICVCISFWVIRELYEIKELIKQVIMHVIKIGHQVEQGAHQPKRDADQDDDETNDDGLAWGSETDEEFLEDQRSVDLTEDQKDRRDEYRMRKGHVVIAERTFPSM